MSFLKKLKSFLKKLICTIQQVGSLEGSLSLCFLICKLVGLHSEKVSWGKLDKIIDVKEAYVTYKVL